MQKILKNHQAGLSPCFLCCVGLLQFCAICTLTICGGYNITILNKEKGNKLCLILRKTIRTHQKMSINLI